MCTTEERIVFDLPSSSKGQEKNGEKLLCILLFGRNNFIFSGTHIFCELDSCYAGKAATIGAKYLTFNPFYLNNNQTLFLKLDNFLLNFCSSNFDRFTHLVGDFRKIFLTVPETLVGWGILFAVYQCESHCASHCAPLISKSIAENGYFVAVTMHRFWSEFPAVHVFSSVFPSTFYATFVPMVIFVVAKEVLNFVQLVAEVRNHQRNILFTDTKRGKVLAW